MTNIQPLQKISSAMASVMPNVTAEKARALAVKVANIALPLIAAAVILATLPFPGAVILATFVGIAGLTASPHDLPANGNTTSLTDSCNKARPFHDVSESSEDERSQDVRERSLVTPPSGGPRVAVRGRSTGHESSPATHKLS